MVPLLACGNFQDRIVLGLTLPLEADGPLPLGEGKFGDDAFRLAPAFPAQNATVTMRIGDVSRSAHA
jgi:hypothetical protein